MNVSNTRIHRLSSLLSALNLNVRRNGFNYAMIKAIDAGMTLVEEYFDKILSEVFFDSAKNYGIKMMCDLLDLDEVNYENVQKGLSQGFVKYKYDEFKEECLKTFDKNMTFSVSNFIFSAGGSKESFLSQILKNISYFEKYICPGVVMQANECIYDFDALDALDYNADDWDKIAKISFNFIDSLGGAQ
jgi:hypothetical protein